MPNLPINCWGKKTLSQIDSGLGNPPFADECTSTIARISYARVLIEMDVTQPLPKSIKAKYPKGNVFEQVIEYDWEPEYCATCLRICHNCQKGQEMKAQPKPVQGRNTKPKQVWQTKMNHLKVRKLLK